MAAMTCMNAFCGSSTSVEWREGWPLRSGGFANLCDKCGSAYEQSIFCNLFHAKDSGWRECASCGKRVHCGCIGSAVFIELLDSGGVNCISCSKNPGLTAMNEEIKPNGFVMPPIDHICQLHVTSSDNQLSGGSLENRKFIQLSNNAEGIGLRHLTQLQNSDLGANFGPMKQEEVLLPAREMESVCFSGFNQTNGLVQVIKPDICKENIYESLMQTNLSISLGAPLNTPSSFPGSFVEEKGKISTVMQHASKSRQLLPRPPKSAFEGSAGLSPQIRVARPPAEGRGRNQLLPRYWPRITDQELQQISGDSNSTIVPLFEKVLSASDAGRIGRLVLPKACAEAYFPPISQPEGLPLRIQDIKGKEWVFQFRFWPNNNSRMYVLEGVTPCIQSMQLEAGDTVTFSRIDPEGKLVMGFRKATNAITIQETQPSAFPNGNLSSESFFSGVFEKLPIISGYSGLLQSLKGSSDPHLNTLSKHLNSARADISWCRPDKHDDRKEGLLLGSSVNSERKRTRNIGSKSKRLIIDNVDALELKLTWEEAQEMLRPPPSVKPSIVKIEDHDFEEYEEPPVFGKRSIFVVRSTGEQEQWVQCESCSKWRKLPVDVLLPPNWTCAENTWDQSRSSCSSPDELTPKELENLLRQNKEFKRRKMIAYEKSIQEQESSGLDALASAAMIGDKDDNPETTSVAATTRHPRHRPGCSCIVCIQPPSGKGKHKPTCTCIVCMTVKRRFKTLMMRKKKRQSESEAEAANRNHQMYGPREEAEVDSSSKPSSSHPDPSENESKLGNELELKSPSNNPSNNIADSSKGEIDLNSNPGREDNSLTADLDRVSMVNLLQVATLPLETYLKENGISSLATEHQASSLSHAQTRDADHQEPDDQSASEEQGSVEDENCDTEMDRTRDDGA